MCVCVCVVGSTHLVYVCGLQTFCHKCFSKYSPPQYVFKVPQGEAEVMVSLMQEDPRSALTSVGGKNFAIGFYIMKVSLP